MILHFASIVALASLVSDPARAIPSVDEKGNNGTFEVSSSVLLAKDDEGMRASTEVTFAPARSTTPLVIVGSGSNISDPANDEEATDASAGSPVDVMKCCPDGHYSVFIRRESDGTADVNCVPFSTSSDDEGIDAKKNQSTSTRYHRRTDNWAGRIVHLDAATGLMRTVEELPDIRVSYSVPTCFKSRTLLLSPPENAENEPYVLFTDGILALSTGGYVRPGQFCLDLFSLHNDATTEGTSSSGDVNADSLPSLGRGAVVCSESVWIPPGIEAGGGSKGAVVAYPRCCRSGQALNSELKCTNVSRQFDLIPVRDAFDGRFLNDSVDQVQVNVIEDVLSSKLRASCARLEPVVGLETSAGDVKFHLLHTGHLFFPAPWRLFEPMQFCLDHVTLSGSSSALLTASSSSSTTTAADDANNNERVPEEDVAFVCLDDDSSSVLAADDGPASKGKSGLQQWREEVEPSCTRSPSTFCVIKCCPQGQLLTVDLEAKKIACDTVHQPASSADGMPATNWTPTFYDSYDRKTKVRLDEDAFRVVTLKPVCEDPSKMTLPLMPDLDPADSVSLLSNGRVHLDKYDLVVTAPSYCMDHGLVVTTTMTGEPSSADADAEDLVLQKNASLSPSLVRGRPLRLITNVTLVCFPSEKASWFYTVYAACLIVSAVFLALTFAVSLALPDAIWLVNWTLLNYVGSLFAGSIVLVVIFLAQKRVDDGSCVALAMLQVFTYLSSFMWLNVMSFDIWHANFFWYTRRNIPTPKSKVVCKYLLRCLYAFGVPLTIVAAMAVLQFAPGIPDSFVTRPIDVSKRCWFANRAALWLFYLGPIAIVVLANVVFFILTAHFLFKHQQNTRDLNLHKKQRSRFCLFLRLFVVMGVGWIIEIVSAIVGPNEVWLISDIVNASIGLLVFVIFVCPRRTREGLWRKFFKPRLRRGHRQDGPQRQQSGRLAAAEGEDDSSCCRRFFRRICCHPSSSRLAHAARSWTNKVRGRSKTFSLVNTAITSSSADGNGAGGGTTTLSSSLSSSMSSKAKTSSTWIASPPKFVWEEGEDENVKRIRIKLAEDSTGGDGASPAAAAAVAYTAQE